MRQGRDVQGCALLLAALLGGCDGCHESKTSTLGAGAGGGGGGEPSIPPDPATVATPLDRTVATAVGRDAAFLYSAEDPIQKGVAPGTIDPLRTSVLRGAVTTRDGEPLPGVLVRVLGHSEYGETATRLDAGFDLMATEGTANHLAQHGITARVARKLHEGRPNILDAISNGEIQLVVNTPIGKRSRELK